MGEAHIQQISHHGLGRGPPAVATLHGDLAFLRLAPRAMSNDEPVPFRLHLCQRIARVQRLHSQLTKNTVADFPCACDQTECAVLG